MEEQKLEQADGTETRAQLAARKLDEWAERQRKKGRTVEHAGVGSGWYLRTTVSLNGIRVALWFDGRNWQRT